MKETGRREAANLDKLNGNVKAKSTASSGIQKNIQGLIQRWQDTGITWTSGRPGSPRLKQGAA